MRALLVLLDLGNRLGVIAALLLLPNAPRAAGGVAAGAACVTALRALVRGELTRRELTEGWRRVIAALRTFDVPRLERLREDEAGVAVLLDGVREQALHRAVTLPETWAHAAALAVLAALWALLLPLPWLGAVAGGGLVLSLLFRPLLERQRRAQVTSFETLGPTARDLRALIGAGAELRVSGGEAPLVDRLQGNIDLGASAEREAARLNAAHAIVPAALAVVAGLTPSDVLSPLTEGENLFALGVLGASTLTVLLGMLRLVEARRRAAPYLSAVETLLSKAGSRSDEGEPRRTARLVISGLSVHHPGGRVAPSGLDLELTRGGLALLGPNGSGKSTALRAILGLLEPSAGEVRHEDAAGARVDRPEAAFLPQRPYVDASETLKFHLGLTRSTSPALEHALTVVGLRDRLSAGVEIVRAGELSGGELQRALIARTLWADVGLVALDEPEAGLDAGGRRELAAWLEEAAGRRMIVIAAHDESVVPAGFRRVVVHDASAPQPGPEPNGPA